MNIHSSNQDRQQEPPYLLSTDPRNFMPPAIMRDYRVLPVGEEKRRDDESVILVVIDPATDTPSHRSELLQTFEAITNVQVKLLESHPCLPHFNELLDYWAPVEDISEVSIVGGYDREGDLQRAALLYNYGFINAEQASLVVIGNMAAALEGVSLPKRIEIEEVLVQHRLDGGPSTWTGALRRGVEDLFRKQPPMPDVDAFLDAMEEEEH